MIADNILSNTHIDILILPLHIVPMSDPLNTEYFTMRDLIETRQRYQRLLDALGHTSRTDRELRVELIETIEHFDRKIGQMSHAANVSTHPGSARGHHRRRATG